MGLEYISQPQVFLQPITAVQGIQTGLIDTTFPPLYTSFFTWTSTSTVTATTFPLTGIETLTDKPGSFIVTVGGVLQSPRSYSIEISSRSIIFSNPVNENTPVLITQIGTVAASSLSLAGLTADGSTFINSNFVNICATNLQILSSVTGSNLQIENSSLTNVTAVNVTATNVFVNNLTAVNATLINLSSVNQVNVITSQTVNDLSAINIRTNAVNSINLTASNITVVSNNIFQAITFTLPVSALAIQVNGQTLYLPLLSGLS